MQTLKFSPSAQYEDCIQIKGSKMITSDEIIEHNKIHGIDNPVQDMGTKEYAAALDKDALLMVDHHGFVVDSLTGRPLAADREQLDLLITHLEKLRKDMPKKNGCDLLKK